MQTSILRKKYILLKGRRKGLKEGEGSSSYHHSTDVQTKCVGLPVSSSLRLSRSKAPALAALNEPSHPAAAKEKYNISILALICSDVEGAKGSGWEPSAAKSLWPHRRKLIQFQADTVKAGWCSSQVAWRNSWVDIYRAVDWACCLFPSLSWEKQSITKTQTGLLWTLQCFYSWFFPWLSSWYSF